MNDNPSCEVSNDIVGDEDYSPAEQAESIADDVKQDRQHQTQNHRRRQANFQPQSEIKVER
jgi:hypothetical protein